MNYKLNCLQGITNLITKQVEKNIKNQSIKEIT